MGLRRDSGPIVSSLGNERFSQELALSVHVGAGYALTALGDNPHLRAGLNVHMGKVTNRAVAESLGLDYSPFLLAA